MKLMKSQSKIFLLTTAVIAISGCSQVNQNGADGGYEDPCEVLKNSYFTEYQAYVDARAANGGVEDSLVMSHYLASGDYAIQFAEADCEAQGYSLDTEASGNTLPENPAASDNYTNADGVPIDVTTEEYISGRQIGETFYQAVDPYAIPPYTASETCARALNTGYIFSFGKTVAVFPQARSTLNTDNGFQGCLDGFNGIPME